VLLLYRVGGSGHKGIKKGGLRLLLLHHFECFFVCTDVNASLDAPHLMFFGFVFLKPK
jgi:hypothetical protein